MASAKEAAEQYVKDLQTMNVASLMTAFTPAGMVKAMTVLTQLQANGGPKPITGYTLGDALTDGEDEVIEITLENAEGQATMITRWKDVLGAWKVDDIAFKA